MKIDLDDLIYSVKSVLETQIGHESRSTGKKLVSDIVEKVIDTDTERQIDKLKPRRQ